MRRREFLTGVAALAAAPVAARATALLPVETLPPITWQDMFRVGASYVYYYRDNGDATHYVVYDHGIFEDDSGWQWDRRDLVNAP